LNKNNKLIKSYKHSSSDSHRPGAKVVNAFLFGSKKLKEKYEINQLDGIKISINENTWSLIRRSNTEDIIRVSTESNDKQMLEDIQKEMTVNVKSCYEEIK
jgi:phosphomannomutase